MSDILSPAMIRARSAVRCTLLFPAEVGPTIADAVEIADESAICLVESDSHPMTIEGSRWWDTSYAEPDVGLEQALRYLAARGILVRYGANPKIVTFNPEPAA